MGNNEMKIGGYTLFVSKIQADQYDVFASKCHNGQKITLCSATKVKVGDLHKRVKWCIWLIGQDLEYCGGTKSESALDLIDNSIISDFIYEVLNNDKI